MGYLERKIKMKFPNIDLQLLRGKCQYFFYCGGMAGVLPFLPVIAKQLGVTPEGIGILYTVLPFVALVTKPVLSTLADKYRKQKLLLICVLVTLNACFFSINFIPEIQRTPPPLTAFTGNFACGEEGHLLSVCNPSNDTSSSPSDTVCSVSCLNVTSLAETYFSDTLLKFESPLSIPKLDPGGCQLVRTDNSNITACPTNLTARCDLDCRQPSETETETSIYSHYQYWWLALCMIIAWVDHGMVMPITDAVIYNILGKERTGEFGITRLWGTVGWGMNIVIVGIINKVATSGEKANYSPGFYVSLTYLFITILVASGFKVGAQQKPSNMMSEMGQLIKRPRVAIFVVSVFLVGLISALVEVFLFLYLSELEADSLLLGVSRGVQCFIGEVPFFIIAGRVIKKFGHVNCMSLVFVGYAIRFFGYSAIYNPWHVLPFEVLHGVTFGIFYSTMTSYASILAPTGMSTALQGIVGALYEGAGIAIGSLVGGIVYQRLGGRSMYWIFGVASIGACILHIVSQYLVGKFIEQVPEVEEKPKDPEEESKAMLKQTDKKIQVVPSDGGESKC